MENQFKFDVDIENVEDKPIYDHGYSEEEVFEINSKRQELYEKKLRVGKELTVLDFKTVIIPWLRIHRTETFNLFQKIKKEKKEKPVKEAKLPASKKLTKTFIKNEIRRIVDKLIVGPITAEEQKFLETHAPRLD